MKQQEHSGRRVSAVSAIIALLSAVGCRNPVVPEPTPAESPEIHLQQGSTSLPNGAGEYIFAEAVLVDGNGGFCTGNVAFAIDNQGKEWLNISRVVLSSGDIADFDLDTSSLYRELAPSSYTNFSLRFDPVANLGVRSAVVTIISDDPANGIYTLRVKGTGMMKCAAGDGAANSYFGTSAAISADTMVVGAYGALQERGAAYVFERNLPLPDNWGQTRRLVASDGTAGNRFGESVAISGDTIVVGAKNAGGNGLGAAYVFDRNRGGAGNWGEVKKLAASDASNNDYFGCSVAIYGDTIVVGASGVDDSTGDQGAAYVFYRNQGGAENWGEAKRITASDAALIDFFGYAVAIAGDRLAVSAPYDDETYGNQGSVYLFDRNLGGTDNWGEATKIVAGDAGEYHLFGWSVALEGDLLVAGRNDGAAYLFARDPGGAGGWTQVQRLAGSDTVQYDYFGRAVGISGDTVAVGGLWDDGSSGSDMGSVYLFSLNAGGVGNWGEVRKLTAGDAAGYDSFGSCVAVAGSTIMIGANGDDIGANGNQGSAYVFEWGP